MIARDIDTSPYAYIIAVTGGTFFTWYAFLAASVLSNWFDTGERGLGFIGSIAFAAAHVVLGGVFGLVWPEKAWRWGVWLCALPVCLISFAGAAVFFWLAALTLAPACAGAYVAARVHLKYVEAE